MPGFTGFYLVLPSFTGFFTGFYLVLPVFYQSYLVLRGFYRVLPGFIGLYRILPGFCLVLLGFTVGFRLSYLAIGEVAHSAVEEGRLSDGRGDLLAGSGVEVGRGARRRDAAGRGDAAAFGVAVP